MHKISAYNNKYDANTSNIILLKCSEPAKALLKVNLIVNTSHRFPILHLNLLKVLCTLVVDKLGIFQEISILAIIDLLHDDQQVDVPL